MKPWISCLCFPLFFCFSTAQIIGQQPGKATISEYNHLFKTYPFSDPDPVPILRSNEKIYPYHRYDGYSHEARMREWKVVKLENDYIEVYVLPEVGGKVWGAIEKSTGHEFIYRNEVMKFRNISMRGPWTSGGIEFNFGIIGHHPSTATPVDYYLSEHDDGSVSCMVGNIDLPSHTQWRVEIFLEPGKAYFETRTVWYNPTHNAQSYYNWMTGAAVASQDLEFFCPGNAYLGHPGDVHPWPENSDGRQLNRYSENNFGGSKSYHVVGKYNDFFGGYYHDKDVGFGHWSPYDEMPGQKLWLWALSRSGGIWEDLLTDTDQQYIEFQAGRLFNQFSPGKTNTPITQAEFEPGRTDIWREIWFPVRGIGGLTEVSPKAVMHVEERTDSLVIGLNALETVEGAISISSDNSIVRTHPFKLKPMDVEIIKIINPKHPYEIKIPAIDIYYRSNSNKNILDRSFEVLEIQKEYSAETLFKKAREEIKFRNYRQASEYLKKCLDIEPMHLNAITSLADLKYRSAQFDDALQLIRKALQLDTYDPGTNFTAGKIYTALHKNTDALECFGWAAHSLKYRADAYCAMGELYLKSGNISLANKYARNALDFNRFHIGARYVLTIASRLNQNDMAAIRQIATIRGIDPLNHFAKMEQFLLTSHQGDKNAFLSSHRNELKYQTFLELASVYLRLGQDSAALEVLQLAPEHALISLWMAALQKDLKGAYQQDHFNKFIDAPPHFVFPYRIETLTILHEALNQSSHWKIKYYLALNYWSVGRKEESFDILDQLGEKFDYAPLHLVRASLKKQMDKDPASDLEHAVQIDKNNWRSWKSLIEFYIESGEKTKAINAAEEAHNRLPNNYAIGMLYAKTLLENNQNKAAVDVLQGTKVLPFEGAYEGRHLWEQANLSIALDLLENNNFRQSVYYLESSQTWPENLGVGRPYDPDQRLSDYLLAYSYRKLGDTVNANKYNLLFDQSSQSHHKADDVVGLIYLKHNKNARSNGSDRLDLDPVLTEYIEAYDEDNIQKMQEIESSNEHLFFTALFSLVKRTINLP